MREVVIDPTGDVTLVVSPPEKAPAYAPGTATTATTQPQRFRVSSHNLIAGSKFFETLLTIPGSEGEGLRVDGTTVLRIPDTAPSMFTILLVLLYSPPREVAQPMDLESITLLAVQAYYFQCEKVLQHPSAQRSLHRLLELLYKNAMDPRGLFVAWMYRNAEKFKEFTYSHLRHGQGDLETRQLPFPKNIVFTINHYRRGAILRIMRALCSRVHKLQDNTLCCYMCDSFQLGVLVRELDTLRLCPACIRGEDLPYQTHSIDQLLKFLDRLKNQPCIRRDANGALSNPSGVCAAHWNQSEIEELLSQERSNLKGLELEWFEGSYAW
ncbi:uncharacterized protein LDX57_011335 [Aspergillus melleus]|uniref:uncharacterized protein n=1 Tax=Aspergillus melleus TaxID=138277 RepID=UPI001E8EC1EA|nr:uncharacterized protein LDX57_011335 [Aspergillus melleus]KAH8433701.1 hypothetical protein LDX57_011335 [Aspergillus melleus]